MPEVVEPDRITVRGYSTALLGLLESGDIDYTFEYESVARQRGLRFLALPEEIDLSSEEHSDYYAQVKVEMDFRRFASVSPEFIGEPILYGITIPANAPHREQAIKFIAFLLGADGRRVLSASYQPLLSPSRADNLAAVPPELKALLETAP